MMFVQEQHEMEHATQRKSAQLKEVLVMEVVPLVLEYVACLPYLVEEVLLRIKPI